MPLPRPVVFSTLPSSSQSFGFVFRPSSQTVLRSRESIPAILPGIEPNHQKTVPRGHHTPYWTAWLRICGPSTDSGGGFSLLRCRPEAVHPSLYNHEARACAQTPLLTTALDRTDPRCTRQTKSAARAPDPRGLSPHLGHRRALPHPTATTSSDGGNTSGAGGTRRRYGAGVEVVLAVPPRGGQK